MIPSQVHLIWVGSTLPNESNRPYRRHLHQWRTLNPHWTVNLWINSEDMSAQDWHYLTLWTKQKNIRLRSIDEFWHHPSLGAGICEAYAAQRYASVSDILRVLILSIEGGLYVDFDVQPIVLCAAAVPFGAAFCLNLEPERVRSVVPHAVLMMSEHPFAEALILQLECNLHLFRKMSQGWANNPKREYQYAATVGVTGTIYSLLIPRIAGLLSNREQIMKLQMPYNLNHEEHNSWLEPRKGPLLEWRPLDYLAAQKEWCDRQGDFTDIEDIAIRYEGCTIGDL